MKNLIILGLGLALSASALAQSPATIEQDSADISRQIQREGRYLSPAQRSMISRNLDSIRAVLNGRPSGGNSGNYGAEYTCVSRDNDGRSPYVIGIKEGIQVTRLKEETFSTEQACRQGLDSTRTLGRITLMCVSRDNDGRNPFQFGILDASGIVRVQRTVTSSAQECQTSLGKLRPTRRGTALCASRDNDGRSPYVPLNINLATGAVEVGTESFSDLSVCESFLGN